VHADGCVQIIAFTGHVRGAKNILEVGTSIGYSTLWLALAAQQTNGVVHTIDAFAKRQDEAKANLQEAGLAEHVVWHLGDALETIQNLVSAGTLFDVVFLDAAKKEYLAYFEALHPFLSPTGLFIADNTQSHRNEMQPFVDAILAHPDYLAIDLDTPNGLIIAQKRAW
jgi:predicted O-methyltransferase YrrM